MLSSRRFHSSFERDPETASIDLIADWKSSDATDRNNPTIPIAYRIRPSCSRMGAAAPINPRRYSPCSMAYPWTRIESSSASIVSISVIVCGVKAAIPSSRSILSTFDRLSVDKKSFPCAVACSDIRIPISGITCSPPLPTHRSKEITFLPSKNVMNAPAPVSWASFSRYGCTWAVISQLSETAQPHS